MSGELSGQDNFSVSVVPPAWLDSIVAPLLPKITILGGDDLSTSFDG